MILTKIHAECLSLGSRLLGCGGGGNAPQGQKMYEAAFQIAEERGHVIELISVEELAERNPDGGVIVTISGVGSPASPTAYTPPEYYPRLMQLLQKQMHERIIGFVACEIGASSTFEPFVPAAMLGVPVIDAPCDGRAHPLGLMGSLGLEKKGISVVQAGVGGRKGEDGSAGQYVEITTCGSVEAASSLIRNASAQAGGFLAVARNPVDLTWLSENAACGAYMQTLKLGQIWKEMLDAGRPAEEMAETIASLLGGSVLGTGILQNYGCVTENALDHGQFDIVCDTETYTLTFFNEYMTLEDQSGVRHATFPDGMILIGEDRRAYSSAMLAKAAAEEGCQRFTIVIADYDNLKIPTGVRYRSGYHTCESIIQKEMISYLDKNEFFLDQETD